MGGPTIHSNHSLEEYLQLSATSKERYEYLNGEVFALADSTVNHSRISGNVYFALSNHTRTSRANFEILPTDAKVFLETSNAYFLPDIMAICGPVSYSDEKESGVTNPILIVEVLSKETAQFDRGEKFFRYRQISSLQEYILIEQHQPLIDQFQRQADNSWKLTSVSGLENQLTIHSLGATIPVKEIYRNVTSLSDL